MANNQPTNNQFKKLLADLEDQNNQDQQFPPLDALVEETLLSMNRSQENPLFLELLKSTTREFSKDEPFSETVVSHMVQPIVAHITSRTGSKVDSEFEKTAVRQIADVLFDDPDMRSKTENL